MERFIKKEVEYLIKVKTKITSICKNKKCTGFDAINKCECFKKFVYIKELVHSKIPRDYWMLSLKRMQINNIYKQYIKKYVNNLDNAIESGLGLMYCGPKRGIGKTTSMSIIGKEAIKRGYEVFYVIAQNIIDDRFSEEKNILERIKECDLLLIDELDKIIMRNESNIPKQLENLLREILPNKKAIIICTNFTEEEVEERFQIISLMKRYMKIIPMDGKDFSDSLAERWEKRLEADDVNFNDEVLIRDSQQYFEGRNYEK